MDSALKKDGNYYPLVFLKEKYKYTEKKVVRNVQDNLRDFSHSSDESDEE